MAWDDQIFRYCERGQDPSFWAEPVNAWTNAAFIVAGLLATRLYLKRPRGGLGAAEALLIVLVFAMGVGSFLFHTYATVWASYADTGPIGVFMLAYFAYTLRRLLGLPWLAVLLGLGLFVWSLESAGGLHCQPSLLPRTAASGASCLNGTAGYLPAFAALVLTTAVLAAAGHPVWRHLAAAAAVFLASMTFRTLDIELCPLTRLMGRQVGTHFLWHILNATTLYILLRGAILEGAPRLAPPAPGGHKSPS